MIEVSGFVIKILTKSTTKGSKFYPTQVIIEIKLLVSNTSNTMVHFLPFQGVFILGNY